jgi:hypothetical protein
MLAGNRTDQKYIEKKLNLPQVSEMEYSDVVKKMYEER